MKIKKSCILALLFLSNQVLGQSTTANNLQLASQVNFLGYTNNFALRFHTNNIHYMTLTGTGTPGTISGALGLKTNFTV